MPAEVISPEESLSTAAVISKLALTVHRPCGLSTYRDVYYKTKAETYCIAQKTQKRVALAWGAVREFNFSPEKKKKEKKKEDYFACS
jgi:hypothetical protein